MKIKAHGFEDAVFGAEKEMEFSVDSDNHVIFEILRDKMYSDKIAAVCREVASNSRDANREAGRGDTPVKISIITPNNLLSQSDECIIFEDVGPGISPDRMADVFIKYGSSTKRSTNAQTGGFGLGAKTPFAYNDTFTILTVCDYEGKRMKYEYSAIIDSSGKGKMILFGSEEVGEDVSTGTKIIVPIDPCDKHKFEKECIKATLLWNVRPKFIGFQSEIPQIDPVWVHENEDGDTLAMWIDSDTGQWFGDAQYIARVDGIGYPLNRDTLGWFYNSCDTDLVLCFETGDLTISANREQLQYDEETIATLTAALEDAVKFMAEQVKKAIEKADTKLDKAILYNEIIKGRGDNEMYHHYKFCRDQGEQIKVEDVQGFINVRHTKIMKVSFDHNGNSVYDTINVNNIYVNENWRLPIYWMDARKDARRNQSIIDNLPQGAEKSFFLITYKYGSYTEGWFEEAWQMANDWELDIKFYSEVQKVERPKKDSPSYKKTNEVSVKVREFDRSAWVEINYRMVDTGYNKETLTYVRDEDTILDYTSSEIYYYAVDNLSSLRVIEGELLSILKTVEDYTKRTILVINKKQEKSYFSKYQSIQEPLKQLIEQKRGMLNQQLLKDKVTNVVHRVLGSNRIYRQNWIKYLSKYFPSNTQSVLRLYDKVNQQKGLTDDEQQTLMSLRAHRIAGTKYPEIERKNTSLLDTFEAEFNAWLNSDVIIKELLITYYGTPEKKNMKAVADYLQMKEVLNQHKPAERPLYRAFLNKQNVAKRITR